MSNCKYRPCRLGIILTSWSLIMSNHISKPCLLCLFALFSILFLLLSIGLDWSARIKSQYLEVNSLWTTSQVSDDKPYAWVYKYWNFNTSHLYHLFAYCLLSPLGGVRFRKGGWVRGKIVVLGDDVCSALSCFDCLGNRLKGLILI